MPENCGLMPENCGTLPENCGIDDGKIYLIAISYPWRGVASAPPACVKEWAYV